MEARMSSRSGALVLLAALCLALVGLALLRGPVGRPAASLSRSEPEARPERVRAEAELALERPQQAGSESRQLVPAAVTPAAAAAAAPKGTGRLRIRALDGSSGVPLEHVRLRVASATRMADREFEAAAGDPQFQLTPGTYSLLALARGYEPLELQALEVRAGQTLEPEPLRLRAGSARILGLASGDLEPGRGLRAELVGASSGLAATSSRAAVPPDGRFAFDELVGGSYLLRLVDARERTIGLPQAIELCAGQVVRVDLDAATLRALEVELLDADGRSLAPEWEQRVRGRPADDGLPLELEIVEAGSSTPEFACTFRAGETCIARAMLGSPEPLDSPRRAYASCRGGTFTCCGLVGRRAGAVDDRPRSSSEALRLPTQAPQIEPAQVRAWVGEDGLAHFESLPEFESTLELACGPFRASVGVPAARETRRVRAALARAADSSARTFLEYEALELRR
jgi:hypothetical protein